MGRRECLVALAAFAAGFCGRKPHAAAGPLQNPETVAPVLSWEEIAARAREALTEDERRLAAVYLDARELPEGSLVEIGKKTVRAPWPAVLVFVDRAPQANWSHSCRYLLVHRNTGAIQSIESDWPPFLREVPKTLHLIWKGPAVPDWAVVVREPIG